MVAPVSEVCAGASSPQAPPVVLPFTGLPPHVTVQSTPAPVTSPLGVIVSFAASPTPMDVIWAEAEPFTAVTEMAPARTDEPPPQPVTAKPASIRSARK